MILQEHGVKEVEPVATMGWIIKDGSSLRVVRAPSDRWGKRADEALETWAHEHGLAIAPVA